MKLEDIVRMHYENCLTPEKPYCPDCDYGYIEKSDDCSMLDRWTCTYDKEKSSNPANQSCQTRTFYNCASRGSNPGQPD